MEKYNSNNFREFLINQESIPPKNIRFYQVWVNKFLTYYQKNLNEKYGVKSTLDLLSYRRPPSGPQPE